MFKPNPDIYSVLIDRLTLDNKTREDLKKKRGFTDKTIDILRFRTACSGNASIIQGMLAEFGSGEMFTCGLIDKLSHPAWQITNDDLIIIPYLDFDGKRPLFLQSHKYGSMPGMGVMPYSPFIFGNTSKDTVIFCESAFKAAAMWQLGYRAVGLSGVSTFAGEHLEKLETCYEGAGTAIILFDTEIQDDPTLAAYKSDYRKRYAHHVWGFILGKRLEMLSSKRGKELDVRIAVLPEEWTVDGKSDIDGALAIGHTKDEFEIILKDALHPDVYRAKMNVDPRHKPWVNRRMEAAFRTHIVYERNNSYFMDIYKEKGKGKEKTAELVHKPLSNFVIRMKNTIEKGDEVFREIQLVSVYEDVSDVFYVSSQDMASFKTFREKCLGRGDFIWKGNDAEFNMVIEEIFLDTQALSIKLLEFVGRDEKHKQWVFGNVIIKDEEKILALDEKDQSTFWDADQGYRIMTLSKAGNAIPILSKDPIDAETVLIKFQEAFGPPGITGFTFMLASLFSNPIFNRYHAFPFGMIYGEKEAGKSTLTELMLSLVGFKQHDAAMNISETTQVAIGRKMAYHSSLPCCFDEYRNNEKRIQDKETFIRSIYNRQIASKGTRETFGVREVRVAGTLILIGQERPSDPALQSRMIPMYLAVNTKNQKTWDAVRWLYDHYDQISNVTFQILSNYANLTKKLLDDLEDTRKGLSKGEAFVSSFRNQLHYSILMATLGVFFPESKILEMQKKFMESFVETSKQSQDESDLGKFFNEVLAMRVMGEPVDKYIAVSTLSPSEGIIYFEGIYNLWCKFKTTHGTRQGIWTESTLRSYLKSQGYFMANGVKRLLPNINSRVSCVTIDLSSKKLPDYLNDLFQNILSREEVHGEIAGEESNESIEKTWEGSSIYPG